MRRFPLVAPLLALVLLACAPGLAAAAKAKAKTPSTEAVDAKSAQLLERACAALTDMKSFSVRAFVTLDRVYQDGSKIQSGRDMELTVERPAAFRVVTVGDDLQAVSVFDGKTFSAALNDIKVFGQIPAAMDTDQLMDMLAAKYSLDSPLGDLLSNRPCQNMKPLSGFYVGQSRIEGAACEHLFFKGKDVDWQLWVDEGSKLPRKIVITEKNMPMAPQFTAVLRDWKPLAQGASFAFIPPEGFTRDDAVIQGVKPGN